MWILFQGMDISPPFSKSSEKGDEQIIIRVLCLGGTAKTLDYNTLKIIVTLQRYYMETACTVSSRASPQ